MIPDPKTWDASLVMGIVYTIIYGAMIGLMMTKGVPQENVKEFGVLVGAMTIIQTQIVSYFFGSNKIADDNQRLIAQRIVTPAVAPSDIKADDVKVSAAGSVTVSTDPKLVETPVLTNEVMPSVSASTVVKNMKQGQVYRLRKD